MTEAKITIRISEKKRRQLRLKCLEREMSVQKLLTDFIDGFLEEKKK